MLKRETLPVAAIFQPMNYNAPLSVEVPSVADESGGGGIPESRTNGTQKTPLKLILGANNTTVRKLQVSHSLRADNVTFDACRILSRSWAISIRQQKSLPVILFSKYP